MNVKRLGIPIYESEFGAKYVLRNDLRLALDRDVYERVMSKYNPNEDRVQAEWLESQK